MDKEWLQALPHMPTTRPIRRHLPRGLVGTGLGFAARFSHEAEAGTGEKKRGRKGRKRKRRKHERCRKIGAICSPGGQRCCKDLLCFERNCQSEAGIFSCCKEPGKTCTTDAECCVVDVGFHYIDGICQGP